MIDKKKLIKECNVITNGYNANYCRNQCKRYRSGEDFSECISKVIKNFPEEPEIDFDALWIEFALSDYSPKCTFVDFLKSKSLSAPKPKQLPVKKTWTLKKEYHDFLVNICVGTMGDIILHTEPKFKQYYDYTETPDYSAVKVGDVVEINDVYYGKIIVNHGNKLFIRFQFSETQYREVEFYYSNIKSLTILKAAE